MKDGILDGVYRSLTNIAHHVGTKYVPALWTKKGAARRVGLFYVV